MFRLKELSRSFDISERDKDNVRRIGINLIDKREQFVVSVIEYIAKKYDMPSRVKETMSKNYSHYLGTWFDAIITGKISKDIVTFLMDFNLSQYSHEYYIDDRMANVFSFIRTYFMEQIYNLANTDWEYQEVSKSYSKMLDLSQYMVSHDYLIHKSGLKSDIRVKDYIIKYAEKFSVIVHTLLILFLIVMTVGAVTYFVYDVFKTFDTIPMNKLFITALGSLLIVWVLGELLHSEIQMLKGDSFKISIFVGVVLIAFIRDLLIMTLKHDENYQFSLLLLLGVLVIGFIYWLLQRVEKK